MDKGEGGSGKALKGAAWNDVLQMKGINFWIMNHQTPKLGNSSCRAATQGLVRHFRLVQTMSCSSESMQDIRGCNFFYP